MLDRERRGGEGRIKRWGRGREPTAPFPGFAQTRRHRVYVRNDHNTSSHQGFAHPRRHRRLGGVRGGERRRRDFPRGGDDLGPDHGLLQAGARRRRYLLSGAGVSMRAESPAATKVRVAPNRRSARSSRGTALGAGRLPQLRGGPAGTYQLHETRTPAADTSNPEGYAPCEGGSACRSEVAVTVAAGGAVTATVTNVYPDGLSRPGIGVGPSVAARTGGPRRPGRVPRFRAGTSGAERPVRRRRDADDHLTGTPSAHCAYPEAEEDSACRPFPWSCTMQSAATEGDRSSSRAR